MPTPLPTDPDPADLLRRVAALQAEAERLRQPPDHLRRLPEDAVAEVVAIVISELPCMPHALGMELRAFAESRTIYDARRVSDALRHCFGRAGLAAEVEDLLP
jgi:hypothetical protein